MATISYKAADTNLARAGYFLEIHKKLHKHAGAPERPIKELPRASIVYAVGALDAYLSEMSAEVIVSQLQNTVASEHVRDVLKRIQQDIPTLALELALIQDEDERLGRIRKTIAEHFHNNVSNHGSRAVSAAVQRIGQKSTDLWSSLGARGISDAQQKLDRWTNTRHEIVHQGKRPVVRRPDAQEFLDFVRELVKRIDQLADAALK